MEIVKVEGEVSVKNCADPFVFKFFDDLHLSESQIELVEYFGVCSGAFVSAKFHGPLRRMHAGYVDHSLEARVKEVIIWIDVRLAHRR